MTALFGAACIITPELCSDAISAIVGYTPANLDWGRVPTLLAYFPAGAAQRASHARRQLPALLRAHRETSWCPILTARWMDARALHAGFLPCLHTLTCLQ